MAAVMLQPLPYFPEPAVGESLQGHHVTFPIKGLEASDDVTVGEGDLIPACKEMQWCAIFRKSILK